MYHLRNLLNIRPYFTKSSFEIAIHALITTRLDYCNSLFSGLPKATLRPLQTAQNFAARIVLHRGKFCHITPLLKELHWLPIESRIDFKVLLFVYKARNNLAPPYLSSLLSSSTSGRSLRSSTRNELIIPRSHKCSMGDRAFSIYGPKLWKTLPEDIKDSPSLSIFKTKLKTFIFSAYFCQSH